MNQPLLPTTAADMAERQQTREALITSTSRLAFEVEAAERETDRLAQVRLRMQFHREMAELMLLTPAWCPEKAATIRDNRRGHLDVLAGYEAELAQLEGRG
ncbi:hypothetical protein [Halomonas koreensis]|uniref:Uncharacterized protein n=1 Tax=Halomonas koreensis TaxID=245385 RepID=A0ABU1G4B2_9GAMM|nr:hypothetical protein [Halomonas koreensis]MDR5867274.1 hypothetical protein [Halomonas koreensis]